MSNNSKNTYSSSTFEKVERDIAFLQDRLQLIRRQSKPNRVMLETYSSMLDCRLSVRALLVEKYSNLEGNHAAALAAG